MWWPYGISMGWWMMVRIVIFWGGLIALIVWGITKLSGRGGPAPKHDPLDVAKERYAKGEISREEFEQILRELRMHGDSAQVKEKATLMTCVTYPMKVRYQRKGLLYEASLKK